MKTKGEKEVFGHAEYLATVTTNSGLQWNMQHRFSSFISFYERLRNVEGKLEEGQQSVFPYPPGRSIKWFSDHSSDKFIGARLEKFNSFFASLMGVPEIHLARYRRLLDAFCKHPKISEIHYVDPPVTGRSFLDKVVSTVKKVAHQHTNHGNNHNNNHNNHGHNHNNHNNHGHHHNGKMTKSCHNTSCNQFMKKVHNNHMHDVSCGEIKCNMFMKHGCHHHSKKQAHGDVH